MNNKNIFWIKVKNSSTVSNIFSSTILGQLRKESIYDYGKTNSFVFNKYFDDKKSFWVEAKDHQDIIELIEILSQEFSTPILALWNRKYIAYNSIGRRIEVESEFEKDYCLVASILEESTGYSFDADKFFEDEDQNENESYDFDDEIEDDEDVETYDVDNNDENEEDLEEEYYCDNDDECADCNDELEKSSNDQYFEDDVEKDFSFENYENKEKKSCGENCRCFPNEEFNPIDEIKKETIYHSEKVIELCDEILNSEKLNNSEINSNSSCMCHSNENFDLDDSVNIENDEYVCNGSCSKNIDDFGFFFEESSNNLDDETSSKTLFDIEIDLKENDSFEVKDEQKEEQKDIEKDFSSKIEEEKKNFESTYFNLQEEQKKEDNKYDFIVETIENLDNFLNDKTNTEINIDFDLDKEIEGETFDDEDSLSVKSFDENSEKGFNDFFIVEEENTEKKSNELDFSDKKKSFDINLEENDEKVLEDFFSIINDSNTLEDGNELFEEETIKNLSLDDDNFDDVVGESVLDNAFDSLEDKEDEISNNNLLNNLFSNDEVSIKTNEIDLNELLSMKNDFENNETDVLNEKNIENQNLLNSLFSNDEDNSKSENINLEELIVKNENNNIDESLENIVEKNVNFETILDNNKIDNDALFEKNENFNVDENKDYSFKPNENIDFDLFNKSENIEINTNLENIENNSLNNEEISFDNNVNFDSANENLEFDSIVENKNSIEIKNEDIIEDNVNYNLQDENNNIADIFDQIEKVEDSMYDIYQSNSNFSNIEDSIIGLNSTNDLENEHFENNDEVVTFDEENLNIEQNIFNTTNDLLNETNEYVDEVKNKTLYDMVLDSADVENEVDKFSKELENNVFSSNEESTTEIYKSIHEKNKKVSDELNIFLDELKKEKDLINNREEVIFKREKKLKEIMNSDYAKHINIDSSNRKWRVIR